MNDQKKSDVCSHSSSCALYECFSNEGALGFWKTFYFNARFETCVRYQMSLEGKTPPVDLLPNGKQMNPRKSSATP
jgi:hypothetical protein